MARKWYQVRESEGREFRYTPPYEGNRNYNYIDAAFYNVKGVVSLVYNHHSKKKIPTGPIRKSISEYFRMYGKRRVFVETGKKREYYMQIQVYFLQDEMPSIDQVDYWFGVIKNKIHL